MEQEVIAGFTRWDLDELPETTLGCDVDGDGEITEAVVPWKVWQHQKVPPAGPHIEFRSIGSP